MAIPGWDSRPRLRGGLLHKSDVALFSMSPRAGTRGPCAREGELVVSIVLN
jgi:hypothetical protein